METKPSDCYDGIQPVLSTFNIGVYKNVRGIEIQMRFHHQIRHIVSKVNTPLVKLSEDHSSLPPGGSRVSHKADTTKNAHMFLTCACKRAIASSAKVSATARRASVISV